MRRGDFESAWCVCDTVLQERLRTGVDCSGWPRHLQFVWRGQALEHRRVLVRCYHGLGDTIQFVRLIAPLRQRAREVTLWAQPALLQLLSSVRGVDQLLALQEGVPPLGYDVDIELMELAHALRLSAREIPAQVPYIYVSGQAAGREADMPRRTFPSRTQRIPGPLEVGIAWRSGDWNGERSLPAAIVQRLASAPGVRWHSLQYPPGGPVLDAHDLACKDICELARRMLRLDLVVSVDTMTAHLAGALGLPTWTLLHDPCDWRWMSEREDSPWYPTMRLFRQRAPGDWSEVVEDVLSRLRRAIEISDHMVADGQAAPGRGEHFDFAEGSSGGLDQSVG